MRRLAIVAVLVLSPLNGVWIVCPPPDSTVASAAADECERMCPLHRSTETCVTPTDNAVLSLLGGVTVPVQTALMIDPTVDPGQRVLDSAPFPIELTLAPSTPPPKA